MNHSSILVAHDDEKQRFHLPLPATYTLLTEKRAWLIDAFWVFVNGAATIVVVFLNKAIFSDPQLRQCQITSAIWHFSATFGVLYVASQKPFSLFPQIRLPFLEMIPICVLFASFLVFNNLSLTYNSVSFYQLSKIMTTPCVVFFNFILFRKLVSRNKLLSVIAACVGVALANGNATGPNPAGAFLAVVAFSVTAMYQIWIARSLGSRDISAPQLLMNQTPISVVMLMVLAPFFDTLPNIALIRVETIVYFICAGFVAALINLSQFLIIGRTSALTFSVISIVKTVSVLALGWIVEEKVFGFVDVMGAGMALGGAFMYTQVM